MFAFNTLGFHLLTCIFQLQHSLSADSLSSLIDEYRGALSSVEQIVTAVRQIEHVRCQVNGADLPTLDCRLTLVFNDVAQLLVKFLQTNDTKQPSDTVDVEDRGSDKKAQDNSNHCETAAASASDDVNRGFSDQAPTSDSVESIPLVPMPGKVRDIFCCLTNQVSFEMLKACN
jgi:hypothetical protein